MIFRMGLELRGGPSIPVAFPPRCTRPRGRKIPPIGHQEIIPNFVPARGHLAFLAHVAAAVSRLPYAGLIVLVLVIFLVLAFSSFRPRVLAFCDFRDLEGSKRI